MNSKQRLFLAVVYLMVTVASLLGSLGVLMLLITILSKLP